MLQGGAGTWSDGKLTTRIGRNDLPVRMVLHTLCRFGAPSSILVNGKVQAPHLERVLPGALQQLGPTAHPAFACLPTYMVPMILPFAIRLDRHAYEVFIFRHSRIWARIG